MKIPVLQSHFSKLSNLLYVSYIPKVINAAIEINLFELLSEKEISLMISEQDYSLDNIVARLKIEKSVTHALLAVLIKIGLISLKNDTYSLTNLSKDYLINMSNANQLQDVKHFNGSNGPFDYLLKALKEENADFDNKMWSSKEASIKMEQGTKAGGLQNVLSFVKTIPEFATCTNMCDFAGNVGYFSYAFLQENKKLSAHVYDLPDVCLNAKELKCNEPNYNRISYHDFNMETNDDFGKGYDLFFISHYLYEFGVNGELVNFLKRVNEAMESGGIIISNHVCDKVIDKESELTLSLIELQTRIMGYPTHQLSEETLKEALTEAGFSDFRLKQPDGTSAFPALLLSAKKK